MKLGTLFSRYYRADLIDFGHIVDLQFLIPRNLRQTNEEAFDGVFEHIQTLTREVQVVLVEIGDFALVHWVDPRALDRLDRVEHRRHQHVQVAIDLRFDFIGLEQRHREGLLEDRPEELGLHQVHIRVQSLLLVERLQLDFAFFFEFLDENGVWV